MVKMVRVRNNLEEGRVGNDKYKLGEVVRKRVSGVDVMIQNTEKVKSSKIKLLTRSG